jgi:hypothetical protein
MKLSDGHNADYIIPIHLLLTPPFVSDTPDTAKPSSTNLDAGCDSHDPRLLTARLHQYAGIDDIPYSGWDMTARLHGTNNGRLKWK